ncbi:MAG: hypothetical protein ACT4NY_15395 [Pseudonocardiales bacterium]
MITMDDGANGGDLGTLTGPDPSPAQESCIVVERSDSGGIVWGSDGSSHVVLPRPVPQPSRSDEDATDDPTVSA